MRKSTGWRPAALTLASFCLVACAGHHLPVRPSPTHPIRIRYESRTATEQGLSAETQLQDASFVEVSLLDAQGATLLSGFTDVDGRLPWIEDFRAAQLRVRTVSTHRGQRAEVTQDPEGQSPYVFYHPLTADASRVLIFRDTDESQEAGALHLLRTLQRGLDALHGWLGVRLPLVFAYWGRGVTTEWSYYRGELPSGSGRFALELLGGPMGARAVSDTDEHDEAIVLHELGHFVMDRLSTDSSFGGSHPPGVRVDPGLAWEEGRATFFAVSVLRRPRYQDTVGMAPRGSLRVNYDLEHGRPAVRGIGAETSVARVLWDLADGTPDLPDEDADGVALGTAAVLDAMRTLRSVPGAYPCLSSFLEHLIAEERVTREAIREMLTITGEPTTLLEPQGEWRWPLPLPLETPLKGHVDGLTQPAPSGGTNLPQSGWHAVRSYRLADLPRGLLRVELTLLPGLPEGPGLVMELCDLRGRILRRVETRDRASVQMMVTTPFAIIRVRDGGEGIRTDFQLRASVSAF